MNIFYGAAYVFYLLLLGFGFRFAFVLLFSKSQSLTKINTDALAHAFFQGIVLLLLFLNLLQFFDLSATHIISMLAGLGVMCLIICFLAFTKTKIQPTQSIAVGQVVLIASILLISLFIEYNTIHLPNIAWDSWTVWEGRANQWISHGLAAQIVTWETWITDPNTVHNASANYPDGLSLLYFVPKLLALDAFGVNRMIYLIAYAMTTILLLKRLRDMTAPTYMQVLMVLVMYGMPLLNNHLLISGYADLWIGMILVLILLAYGDYHKFKTKGAFITLVGYLCLLPMFKLEGWVWLFLLVFSHAFVFSWSNKLGRNIILASITTVLLLLTFWGIDIHTPMGQITISSEHVVIFNLIDTPIQFTDISGVIMNSFFWQNNWSLLWLGVPFLLYGFWRNQYPANEQVIHLFFGLSFISFLFLFYFTQASQWAEDFTAINRVILQLVPSYVYLLFKMLHQAKELPRQPTPV